MFQYSRFRLQPTQRNNCNTMSQSSSATFMTTPPSFICPTGEEQKVVVKRVKLFPSQDILELEKCRERPTLLATPNSCPLIFDSLLCFNSTPGMEVWSVETSRFAFADNVFIWCFPFLLGGEQTSVACPRWYQWCQTNRNLNITYKMLKYSNFIPICKWINGTDIPERENDLEHSFQRSSRLLPLSMVLLTSWSGKVFSLIWNRRMIFPTQATKDCLDSGEWWKHPVSNETWYSQLIDVLLT